MRVLTTLNPFYRKLSAREERDAWLRWMLDGGFSVKTVDGYRLTTEKLLNRYPKTRLGKFTEDQITAIIEESTPGSRQRSRAPFTNWFGWAYRTRRIKHNPMGHVPKYRQPDQEHPTVFTEAEVKTLCGLPEPDGTLMAILLGTGMRKSEARSLTVKRLDLEHAELHVVEGAKGGHSRTVPLEPELAQRIADYIQVEGLGDEDFLWFTHMGGAKRRQHGRVVSESAMQSWWERCVKCSGVDYRNMHATRHTFATEWRRRGLDLADVGWLLGHRDLKTTQHVYVHTQVFDVRRRMEALG